MQNSSNKSLSIVIFGATGNLYADKLAKALFLLFQQRDVLPIDFKIFAFARKDLNDDSFRLFTKESILKRGQVDISKLGDFLKHISYVQGDFLNKDDFIKLKNSISIRKDGLVVFHLATASSIYSKIFENIKYAGLNDIDGETRIMIEKPFGKDGSDAKYLQNELSSIFKEENIFQIDHYLAKETARAIFDFKFKDSENISKIKVIFHESNVVGARGSSYDTVGAFRDVGENHMLELLTLLIMNKSNQLNVHSIRDARAKALESLDIDYTKKITRGQYENYISETGVDLNSKTETFFRIFLKSKDPRFSDTVFELEGGKGLIDTGSDITPTTVAVEIYFKDRETKEFKIQPVEGTVYESYVKVYNDVLLGDQTFFPSIEEITTEWKITDELLDKWKKLPLVIYEKGSNGEEIK